MGTDNHTPEQSQGATFEFDIVPLHTDWTDNLHLYAVRQKGSDLSDLHVYVNYRSHSIHVLPIIGKLRDEEVDRVIAAYEAAQAFAAEIREGWAK